MRTHRPRRLVLLALAILIGNTGPEALAARTWETRSGTVTFALAEAHLADLGLSVSSTVATAAAEDAIGLAMEPPLRAFRTSPEHRFRFTTERGRFVGFVGEAPVVVAVRGGFALRADDPIPARAPASVDLFDFLLELDPVDDAVLARIRPSDPRQPDVLEVRNAGLRFDPRAGELSARLGDLVISRAGAERLGRPRLAGRWVGALDLRLPAEEIGRGAAAAPAPEPGRGGGGVVDLGLAELYGLTLVGRVGNYPDGRLGLSAATTSCNFGDVAIPFEAAMSENHPFIALGLYRTDSDGTLEMIGQSWIKHTFASAAQNDCNLGCTGSIGTLLEPGCADTYTVSANASRFYLAPRDEVNPFTGEWEACGSFFDAIPVDCLRDYFGEASDGVEHRLEVWEEDLLDPAASYSYESVYYVRDDVLPDNNICWRDATILWETGGWDIATVGAQETCTPGARILAWGDQQDAVAVAADDGTVILSTRVTDLGGGQWHYEYALLNFSSWRQVRSFEVPVGGAAVTGIGFHDVDHDPGTDWAVTANGSTVRWATDDFPTNPDAPALDLQTMYNFRFDADRPPVPSIARGGLFRPAAGSTFTLATSAPTGDPTSVPYRVPAARLHLAAVEPNPFAETARLVFTLGREADVRLSVVDVTGRAVRTVLDGWAPAGRSSAVWDGRDAHGARAVSGTYFFRLEADGEVRTVKGVLVK